MSIYVNYQNGLIAAVSYMSFMMGSCLSMDSLTELVDSSEKHVERYLDPRSESLGSWLSIQDGSILFDLIDDPKGDSMCQLWALLPLLHSQEILMNRNFCQLLSVFSRSVEKTLQFDANGTSWRYVKAEQQLGGGMTGVARTDLSFLTSIVSTCLEDEIELINDEARRQAQNPGRIKLARVTKAEVSRQTEMLLAGIRVCAAIDMYELLKIPPQNLVQRNGLFGAQLIALPFFDSYVAFLNQIQTNNIKVIINYLQYCTPITDSDEVLAKQSPHGFVQPVTLQGVTLCYPNGIPSPGQNVLMIDMYSAFYGALDPRITQAMIKKLSHFGTFSDYVLQIAASHGQYTDSKANAGLEDGIQDNRYAGCYADALLNSVGVTNLVIPKTLGNKERMAGLHIRWNEANNCLQPVNIPLNTLHVYPVLAREIISKISYWMSWVGREG